MGASTELTRGGGGSACYLWIDAHALGGGGGEFAEQIAEARTGLRICGGGVARRQGAAAPLRARGRRAPPKSSESRRRSSLLSAAAAAWLAVTAMGMMIARMMTQQMMPMMMFIFAFCLHIVRFTSRDDLWNVFAFAARSALFASSTCAVARIARGATGAA